MIKLQHYSRIRIILLITISVAAIAYLIWHTNQYAVNLVFSDQVDLFFSYPDDPSFLDLFLQQHGPHRQGLGSLIMYPLMQFNDWNVRSISFLTVFCMAIQALTLVAISQRLKLSLATSICLIVLSLSLGSSELLTVTSNISHSALPMALTTMLVWLVLVSNYEWYMTGLEALIGILLLFTGFGIFPFFAWVVLCVTRTIYSLSVQDSYFPREAYSNLAFLILSALGLYLFFTDYSLSRAEGCAPTALDNPSRVLAYIGAISSMLLGGAKISASWVGYAIFSSYMLAGFACVTMILRKNRHGFIPLVFVLSAGAFIINASVGRHCLGIDSAFASRYYQFTIIGAVGALIAFELFSETLTKRTYFRFFTASLSLVIILATLTWVNNDRIKLSQTYANHKANFQACLTNEAIEDCNLKFSIYPPSAERLKETLSKTNQL